ncbi:fumarylacetoacetate hydrolase family protein [Desertimonas flava]|uniref:fumarylacetoacetate hydrolase family protein n=1 Tax=Desertimonas flava TaxID=2064846 RepID=UPI000E346562|nr:fumarylacetoacetate hydrolase family protein [Desertimonas flava]
MKLGTVERGGVPRLAISKGDAVAVIDDDDLTVAAAIADWTGLRPVIEARAETAPTYPPEELDWLPPIPRPGKIVCLALNNSANKDRIMSGPEHPATFIKPATALLGHRRTIELRTAYGRVHPEPELAVVIGSAGRQIAATAAGEHVFGYTIVNDLTAPAMRGEDTFHYRAIHPGASPDEVRYVDTWVSYPGRYKGTDGFCPIGPWIVTRDEIADPHALTISCRHRGHTVTEDSTANLRNKVPEVVAFISEYMTLEPGDIIAMGTALKASAGGGRAVQNIDLTATGGPIEVSIEGIGTLTSEVATIDAGSPPLANGRAAG